MPVKPCTSKGKKGKKYGDTGKCYTGKDAEEKAKKQGAAIEISKNSGKQKKKG